MTTIEESRFFKPVAWICVLVLAGGTLALVHMLNTVTSTLVVSMSAGY